MYYERTVEPTIKSISQTLPILIVTGPRQAGKTILLSHMAEKERTIVSLDSPTMRTFTKHDPELFLQRYQPPILIDEIQYAPELFDYIKIYVDREKRPGDSWLTGSRTFRMVKGVTESLADRAGITKMLGLNNSGVSGSHFPPFQVDISALTERLRQATPTTLSQVYARIFRGSMPRLYEEGTVNTGQYCESYLETYTSRDIKDLSQVDGGMTFLNFMSVIAARTVTNVNYETIAGEVDISAPTVKHWLPILVSSGLVVLVQPYFNCTLKRVTRAPRMYFLNTGLCTHLTRWSNPKALEREAMDGQSFETWVVSEVYKSYLNAGKQPSLYFYRDSNKKEIDLLIYEGDILAPVEIKKSSVPKDAVKNFSVLASIGKEPSEEDIFSGTAHLKTTVGTGAVTCMSVDMIPVDGKSWYIPAWLIW